MTINWLTAILGAFLVCLLYYAGGYFWRRYRHKPGVDAQFTYVPPTVTGTIWFAPWYGGEDNMAFMPGEDPPEALYTSAVGPEQYATPLEASTSILFMTMWSNGTYEYNVGSRLVLVNDDYLKQQGWEYYGHLKETSMPETPWQVLSEVTLTDPTGDGPDAA